MPPPPSSSRRDTPAAVPLFPSFEGNRGLRERHNALLNDLADKTEVSLDEFIKRFLPKLPEGIEITSDFLKQMYKSQAWKGFPSSPLDDSSPEDEIFRRLKPIFNKTVKTAQKLWKARCPEQKWSLLTECMAESTTSEEPLDFKPDAFFVRKNCAQINLQTKPFSYYDIALTAEFKTQASELPKVVHAMQHLMAADPRRRFTFGIAIENTSLILWYANRSILVSSTPLDITKERQHLIQILSSFAFASDVDMGWDPSIELVQCDEDHGGDFYLIKVGNTQYKTIKVLSDHRTDYLLSQATRVFTVNKVGDNEDNIYVLKDLWPEQDQKPEHQIYDEIITDVGHVYSEDVNIINIIKQHLFTPLNHAFVEVNGIRDNTKLVASPSSSDNPVTNSSTFPRSSGKICHRWHYRIVFKEYAKPLYKVKKMGEVFSVLADVMKVLQLFHGSGWVHQDISAANLYLYEGHSVLGDLEFAKRTADHSQDERVGTIDFMSVEAMAQEFLFLPRPETPRFGAIKRFTFHYNALHDIESVWWVGVWMMFFCKPRGHEESNNSSELRQKKTDSLFPETLNLDLTYHVRWIYFLHPNEFVRAITPWIAKEFLHALKVFEAVRTLLLKNYADLEKTFPTGHQMLSSQANPGSGATFPGGPQEDIYEPIRAVFLDAIEVYENTEIVPF